MVRQRISSSMNLFISITPVPLLSW